jgi:hypothetical protein
VDKNVNDSYSSNSSGDSGHPLLSQKKRPIKEASQERSMRAFFRARKIMRYELSNEKLSLFTKGAFYLLERNYSASAIDYLFKKDNRSLIRSNYQIQR